MANAKMMAEDTVVLTAKEMACGRATGIERLKFAVAPGLLQVAVVVPILLTRAGLDRAPPDLLIHAGLDLAPREEIAETLLCHHPQQGTRPTAAGHVKGWTHVRG